MIMGDQILRALPLTELYSRAFLHFQSSYFNVLLAALCFHMLRPWMWFCRNVVCQCCCLLSRARVWTTKSKILLYIVGRALQTARVQDVSAVNVASLTHAWVEMSTA